MNVTLDRMTNENRSNQFMSSLISYRHRVCQPAAIGF